MTIDTGGAAAPADPIDVSTGNDQVVTPPNPISTEREPAAPAADKSKPVSIDDALDRAIAKVDDDEKAGKDPAKPVKSEQPRENGKFAGKDPKDAPAKDAKDVKDPAAKPAAVDPAAKPGEQPAKPAVTDKPAAVDPAAKPAASTSPAPARFSADAKAVWDTAPEPVKAEVARMERELTAGIEKHRVAAERDSKIAPFHQMAEESGTDVHTALTKYTNLERLLRTNPLKGIEAVCENIGVSIKDVAKIVLGQPVDQEQSQSEATIRDLRANIQRLEQQLTGVTQRFQQQDESTVHEQIADWAKDKPLFEVLAPHIAAEMRESRSDLDTAYQAVLQKHPQLAAMSTAAPAAKDPPAASSAAANAEELAAQTRKGSKSITGSPGTGSDPAPKKTSKSIDEAIERAFAAAG